MTTISGHEQPGGTRPERSPTEGLPEMVVPLFVPAECGVGPPPVGDSSEESSGSRHQPEGDPLARFYGDSEETEEPTPRKLERSALSRQFQGRLLDLELLAFETIGRKILPLSSQVPKWRNFSRCHYPDYDVLCTCKCCGHVRVFPLRCNLRWCPLCVPILSWRRQRKVELWAGMVRNPKHVVLTARNAETLTRDYVRTFGKRLGQLRRSKLFRSVKAGCQSLELTNEGRGWHLHAHLLLDVPFLPADELARKWAKLVGQNFAIVKVKDVSGSTAYVRELTKYVAKGNAVASWSAEEIVTYIRAFDGVRTFRAFGNFMTPEVREFVANAMKKPYACESCGSHELVTDSEANSIHRRHSGRR